MKNFSYLSMVLAASAGCVWTAQADVLGAKASYGKNEIRLYANPLAYEVVRDGKTMVAKTPIGLKLDGACQKDAALVSTKTSALAGCVKTPVYKKATVCLGGSETVADFGDFAVRLVARNDGVAYRF